LLSQNKAACKFLLVRKSTLAGELITLKVNEVGVPLDV